MRYRQISPYSILRKQTCTPPTAVTLQGNVQPAQWNIGKVQRYLHMPCPSGVTEFNPDSIILVIAARYVPRYVVSTHYNQIMLSLRDTFGLEVVPEVQFKTIVSVSSISSMRRSSHPFPPLCRSIFCP